MTHEVEDFFGERVLEETGPEGAYDVIVDGSATRDEWLEARHGAGRIGSSEMAAVLGLAGDQASAYSVWATKLGLVERGELPVDDEVLEAGHRFEDVAAAWFRDEAERLGWSPRIERWQSLLVSREHPWAAATPDYQLWDPADDRGFGVLELKVLSEFRRSAWEEEDAPLRYRVQLQHQLLVTGREYGVIAAMVGPQRLRFYEYGVEEDLRAQIIAAGEQIARCLDEEVEPELDDSLATSAAQRERWPRPTQAGGISLEGEELERFVALDEEYVRIGQALKALGRRKTRIRNEIQQAIGDGQLLFIPGRSEWNWRESANGRRLHRRWVGQAKKKAKGT